MMYSSTFYKDLIMCCFFFQGFVQKWPSGDTHRVSVESESFSKPVSACKCLCSSLYIFPDQLTCTPNAKMAVARNDLGRAARKRGIEGRQQNHSVFTYSNRCAIMPQSCSVPYCTEKLKCMMGPYAKDALVVTWPSMAPFRAALPRSSRATAILELRIFPCSLLSMGGYHLSEKSGCCDHCIMVRDFPNMLTNRKKLRLPLNCHIELRLKQLVRKFQTFRSEQKKRAISWVKLCVYRVIDALVKFGEHSRS